MTDGGGGTETTNLLEALHLLYKNNYIDERQYKSLVWDIVEDNIEDEEESLRILRAAGVIRHN